MKKVLLVVIDAIASEVVTPALAAGRLPTLARLIDAGQYAAESVSVFPSVTPAATCSLITGRYPREHGIAGAFWYDRDRDEVAFHGDDFWVIMNQGIGNYFQDFMVTLNERRLRTDTLYQRVEATGLSAACLNFMWYRGDHPCEVQVPLLLQLLPGMPAGGTIQAAGLTCLGDFVQGTRAATGTRFSSGAGLFRRYGFDDRTTAGFLLQLAADGPLPDLTVAYFPDNDFQSHEQGPQVALPALERVDANLAEFAAARGGLESLLEEAAVLITGDHAQSDLHPSEAERALDLSELLGEFRLARPGTAWSGDEELMACPNLRAVQIYFRHGWPRRREEVAARLLAEARIDQVFWEEESPGESSAPWYRVATADRGELAFRPAADGADHQAETATDPYGNRWHWRGDLAAVDARRDVDAKLHYGDYPNALERIAGGFVDVGGHLWAACRPGCEFSMPETSLNAAGSHGSLHRLDSLSPLIAAGLPPEIALPAHPRAVDVAPLALAVLGLPFERPAGVGEAVA